jgi:two-component system NtrC family sensor kinase
MGGRGEIKAIAPVEGRSSRTAVLALVALSALALLVFALLFAVTGARRPGALAGLLLLALCAVLLASLPLVLHLLHRLHALERQSAAFYHELTRLAKVASLGEVSSSIAHDLNNPLAIMNEEAGWIMDLLQGAGCDERASREEIRHSVEQIRIQIRRSREITQRILNWARDADEPAAAVDLNLLLNKTLYLLESDLQTGRVRVVKQMTPERAMVTGSVAELRQVFLNLMKNALDAMGEEGGTLTIATTPGPGEVRVSIGDTGTGIPPEIRPRLFEPFFTTKEEGKGSGLGLAISSWIVGKLGGRIEVESSPGQGAVFTVVLPARRSEETQTEKGESHAGHPTAAG